MAVTLAGPVIAAVAAVERVPSGVTPQGPRRDLVEREPRGMDSERRRQPMRGAVAVGLFQVAPLVQAVQAVAVTVR